MRFKLLIACCFLGTFLCAQDNRFVEFPFLRDICAVDTNCTHYQKDHIVSTIDSVYNGTVLSSITTKRYTANGQLISVNLLTKDTVQTNELVVYGINAEGRVISASLSDISGKDTTQLYRCDILKYDKAYRPILQHYHSGTMTDTLSKKQFTDERLIFKYSGTQAATHWVDAYGTDYFIRSSYDLGYGWIQDMVHLHKKDTLYRRINYYNKKYNPVKCETFIWTNDSTKTETVTDSIYNIVETITWVHKKITEHHYYNTQYSGTKVSDRTCKITISDALADPKQPEYVIQYMLAQTLVISQHGDTTHLGGNKDVLFPPPPSPPPLEGSSNLFSYKTRKMEGNLARYDYFNFNVSTKPLLTMWFDEKGVMIKSLSGNLVTKRSYIYK